MANFNIKMVKNGKNDQNGQKFFKNDQNGQKMAKIYQNGEKWQKLVKLNQAKN